MRVWRLVSLASVLLNFVVFGQEPDAGQANGADDLIAIEKLESVDAKAARSNDVDTLASLWTADGVLLQPMAEPVVGREKIRALLQQQKQQGGAVQITSYEESWRERQIHDGRAFEWGTITMTIRLPNGKEMTRSVYAGRYLVRSEDHAWHVARAVITPAPSK